MIVRLEGDEYVVYDANGQEVGRYSALAEAKEAFPLAVAPPLGWEPGQPIPVPAAEVEVGIAGAEPPKEPQVVQAVNAVTSDPRIRRSMLLAAMLEGGGLYGPWGEGAAGEVGPWQIHPIHFEEGFGPEQAADPATAAAFMLPYFIDALDKVPAELWESDPVLAALTVLYHAENPPGHPHETPTTVYGGQRVERAWDAGA